MSTLEHVQAEVAAHMDQIKRLFKRGVKITVLVRTPGYPDRDFMMTDDTHAELITMIERRRTAEEAREIPYNPAWTHGEIGADEAALMEANGWRMRPDGSYFKPGS